ncbi:hypothetical protein [Alteribacter natronophilus]|uniref:hypothetical protein n=1 Tax=Alteribacter natronophilus TaxID=2583810 RepID=UPI00110F3BAA|nr:hypothetical protein [Alteribacter natronophilus]TMW71453.1 hypothetical protein FGB90_10425 [Alteribacter natronophilus]
MGKKIDMNTKQQYLFGVIFAIVFGGIILLFTLTMPNPLIGIVTGYAVATGLALLFRYTIFERYFKKTDENEMTRADRDFNMYKTPLIMAPLFVGILTPLNYWVNNFNSWSESLLYSVILLVFILPAILLIHYIRMRRRGYRLDKGYFVKKEDTPR